MEKNIEQWNEIADLINKEKKKALQDFHNQGFVPGALPKRLAPLPDRRPVMRHVIMAVAVSLVLVAGLFFFWTLNGNWRSVSLAPAAEKLWAGSFLYESGGGLKTKAPESRVTALFSPQLSAWGEAARLNHAITQVAKPVDLSLPTEHGDPAAVQRKMKKVIRENSIERMLTHFFQHSKEV